MLPSFNRISFTVINELYMSYHFVTAHGHQAFAEHSDALKRGEFAHRSEIPSADGVLLVKVIDAEFCGSTLSDAGFKAKP